MKARYLMIGGFLGAGKTTAVARLAEYVSQRGMAVGLITNDQSSGLVDTSILRSRGFAVEEIAGGCFCCRFASLSAAAERLDAASRPDVLIAEPVGSCTDLVATVSYPLRRIYGASFTIAPLSVLVDPERAARILGLAEGRSFSEKVVYVYEKQLEEADLIVVNKIDSIDAAAQERLMSALRERYPTKHVLAVSALKGDGTEEWFRLMLDTEVDVAPTMEVDYQVYAEGEALLGWLNLTAQVRPASAQLFDGNGLLVALAERMTRDLDQRGIEIAHLKATLDPAGEAGSLAALSVTSSSGSVDLRELLIDGAASGELIVNLRAEADPEVLLQVVRAALEASRGSDPQEPELVIDVEHEEHFRPAPPTPTHRDMIPATEA